MRKYCWQCWGQILTDAHSETTQPSSSHLSLITQTKPDQKISPAQQTLNMWIFMPQNVVEQRNLWPKSREKILEKEMMMLSAVMCEHEKLICLHYTGDLDQGVWNVVWEVYFTNIYSWWSEINKYVTQSLMFTFERNRNNSCIFIMSALVVDRRWSSVLCSTRLSLSSSSQRKLENVWKYSSTFTMPLKHYLCLVLWRQNLNILNHLNFYFNIRTLKRVHLEGLKLKTRYLMFNFNFSFGKWVAFDAKNNVK